MATFLLLHGIPGSSATWHQVAARLGEHHRVIAPDLVGFGGEPVTDEPAALLAPRQAEHVLHVLDDAGVDSAIVVGHDFGGPVAAHLLTLAPGRFTGLALFATNAFPDTPIPFPLSMLDVPGVGALLERVLFSPPALRMMVRRGLGEPRPDIEMSHYLGDAAQQSAVATIFANSLRRLSELYTPVEKALRSAQLPALVGWGDRDPFFPVSVGRRTADAVPGARLRVYEGAGHFLPEERPAEIAADLLALAATTTVS